MDEIATMTVPPTLPAKAQSRDGSQVARQTVSIRTVSNPTTATPSTGAGATVFVGLAAPGVDSVAACRRRIPEVQSANGYGKQTSVKSVAQSLSQSQQQTSQQQQQQQQHQAAHVVKIKINPDGDKNGRVISTVRLTLDEKVGHEVEQENGIACERSSKRDGGVVVSATNLVNEQRCGSAGAGEGCVRISVGCNPFERNNNTTTNNNNNNNNNHDKHDRNNSTEKDMVHRNTPDTLNTSADTRSNTCFYYNSYQNPLTGMVMSSGQCSPSDTLDSGTCSDLDGTPPPLPKKKNASTVLLASDQHKRTGSLTSSGAEVDSDDNESNISCDSLNPGDLGDGMIVERNVNGSIEADQSLDYQEINRLENGVDHRNDTVLNLKRLDPSNENEHEEPINKDPAPAATTPEVDSNSSSSRGSPSVSPSPSAASTLSKASSTPRIRSPDLDHHSKVSSPVVKECTYEERKQEQERLEQESIAGDVDTSVNPITGKKYVYEYDRFYKFHMNELKGGNNKDTSRGLVLGDKDTDECFAGYKILDKEAIRSAKGTVRGVKNRVRAGIATFLQKPSSQPYTQKLLFQVIIYTTTSGIVRKTFYNCKKVKQILRTHMVKYDELDLFGDAELQAELRDRLGLSTIQLPQLFIDGQHIGGFDTVERLNESGELRDMLKPYQSDDACTVCLFCGGYQWQLCPICNGSKRSVHRNDFTAEFVALKCAKCDVNGLIRCPHC
ncbi:PREDICTED: putative uncharacterized protein DDB_G0293878 [Dufourea novaeangliae]|uniref:putative uncharacterized protein DDB_G0293878 n=1 Tax=Dufourea novaeangliae TaxID=178035 RepID=UPI000767135E|nr:PREDICTED: putative uncharacterized protein DDB_G0293878 [Dufourea novaeangliae]